MRWVGFYFSTCILPFCVYLSSCECKQDFFCVHCCAGCYDVLGHDSYNKCALIAWLWLFLSFPFWYVTWRYCLLQRYYVHKCWNAVCTMCLWGKLNKWRLSWQVFHGVWTLVLIAASAWPYCGVLAAWFAMSSCSPSGRLLVMILATAQQDEVKWLTGWYIKFSFIELHTCIQIMNITSCYLYDVDFWITEALHVITG